MSTTAQPFLAALRAFGSRPDPRLAVLDPWPVSERPSAALLASVLGQDLTIAGLARLLREIHANLGDALAATSADWPLLEKFSARATWLQDWPHRESMPGWILAASDFLRVHGAPETWLLGFDPPTLVRTLASELPWMGARSSHRVKAWRLCRWLGRGEVGEPQVGAMEGTEVFRAALRVPHAAVERPLKAISALPPGWTDWTPSRRQEWLDGIASEVSPADPAAVWTALETILSRGRSGPACQEYLGSCGKCPLRPRCPSPGRA